MRTATQHIEHNSSLLRSIFTQHIIMLTFFYLHTEYLGFSWIKDGVRIFYKCLVLPFGLASACYLFYQNLVNEVKIALIKRAFGTKPLFIKSIFTSLKRF
jgi:hypothetical protein